MEPTEPIDWPFCTVAQEGDFEVHLYHLPEASRDGLELPADEDGKPVIPDDWDQQVVEVWTAGKLVGTETFNRERKAMAYIAQWTNPDVESPIVWPPIRNPD